MSLGKMSAPARTKVIAKIGGQKPRAQNIREHTASNKRQSKVGKDTGCLDSD